MHRGIGGIVAAMAQTDLPQCDCPAWSLTRLDLAVWAAIYKVAYSYPRELTIPELAERAGVSRSTLFRSLNRLELVGLVRIRRAGLSSYPSKYQALRPPCGWLGSLLQAQPASVAEAVAAKPRPRAKA